MTLARSRATRHPSSRHRRRTVPSSGPRRREPFGSRRSRGRCCPPRRGPERRARRRECSCVAASRAGINRRMQRAGDRHSVWRRWEDTRRRQRPEGPRQAAERCEECAPRLPLRIARNAAVLPAGDPFFQGAVHSVLRAGIVLGNRGPDSRPGMLWTPRSLRAPKRGSAMTRLVSLGVILGLDRRLRPAVAAGDVELSCCRCSWRRCWW
jgi:hypothetical protein